jgi:hypothetical protein
MNASAGTSENTEDNTPIAIKAWSQNLFGAFLKAPDFLKGE